MHYLQHHVHSLLKDAFPSDDGNDFSQGEKSPVRLLGKADIVSPKAPSHETGPSQYAPWNQTEQQRVIC